ncbi:MAG: hypothetical protein WEB52_15115 [Dehalococcoidia bacterium]
MILTVAAPLLMSCGDPGQDAPASSGETVVATQKSGSTPTFPPDPAASVIVSSSTCPVEQELCDFAQRVELLVSEGRADELLEGSPGVPITCPNGVNEGLDHTFPLCDGAIPEEVRYGFGAGYFQPEAYTTDLAGIKELLGGWSSPAPVDAERTRVYTIGCRSEGNVADCKVMFSLVLSSTDPSELGGFFAIVFARTAEQPVIVRVFGGAVDSFPEFTAGGTTEIGVDPQDPSTGPTLLILLFE